MFGNPSGPPREDVADAPGGWQSSAFHEQPQGETSVPEAPPRPASSSRELGGGWLAGTLCADPELRFTQTGKSLAKLRVATASRQKNTESGRWEDGETAYVDVNVWGRQAEHIAEYMVKGDRVLVVGTWVEESYTNREGVRVTRRTMTGRDVGPSMMWNPARVVRKQEGS